MSIARNDVVAIEQAGERLANAVNAGDISSLADFFAPNAMVLPPGRAFIEGSTLIPFFRNMAMQNEGLKFLSTELEPFGPAAVRDMGTLSMRAKQQGAERLFYKYLMLWEKVGESWMLSSMMWNRAPQNRRGQGGGGGSDDM